MAEATSSFRPYVVSISNLSASDETSWKGVPILRWWHEGSVTLKGWIKVAVQYSTKAGEQISWDEHIIESGQTRAFSNTEGQDMTIYLLETAPAPPPPPPTYTCPHCGATFSSQAELNAHIASAHPSPPPPPPPPPPPTPSGEVPSAFQPYVVDIGGLSASEEVSWKGVPRLTWWGEGFVTLKGRIKVAVQYATKAGEQISWNEYIIEAGQTRTFNNISGQDMSVYLLETEAPPPTYNCPYCPATFATQWDLDSHILVEHPSPPSPPPGPSVSGIHLMFGVGLGEDHNRARSCECNLIYEYGPLGRAWLDKAAAAGLWGLYNLKYLIHDRLDDTENPAEQWSIWNNSKNEVRDAINEVKDHPALYGYYTLDEPNLYGRTIPHDLQQDIYNFIKGIDPNHYVAFAIVYSGGAGYGVINFNALDILIPDAYCYAAGGLPELNFGCNNLRNHLDSIGFNKPIIFLLQAEGPGDWRGHIRDQIDVVLNYNLATGGIGMWNWNLDDGPGRSDRTFNEVRDAWGASTWGPPPPPPPVYTCAYCGATFSTQADLDVHIATVHPPPVFTCPHCGAVFGSQTELDVHIATVHPPVPEYTCPYCGATFSFQADLEAHIASVHPVPVFTCPHCGTTFITQAALNNHIASEHPTEPTYTCPYCGVTFDSQGELNTHIASEHPIAAEVPWYKKYAPFLAIGGAIGVTSTYFILRE